MSIKKMLLLTSMALAAVAFAAPAAAQANVWLSDEGGTVLKPNAKVTATSTNLKTTAGGNTLECKKVTLHYNVVTNSKTGKHVVLDPVKVSGTEHNGVTQECQVVTPFGTFAATVTNAGTKQLTINTWGTGIAASTFTSAVPAVGSHCSYSGNVHFQGTNGTDIAHAAGPLTAPEGGCENAEIHGTVTLETSNGVPVIINHVETP